MRNGRNFFDYWWILLFFGFFVGDAGILPLIILVVVVIALMSKSIKDSRNQESEEHTTGFRSRSSESRSTVNRYGFHDEKHSADQKARVNVYLMKRFNNGEERVTVTVPGHQITLVKQGDRFRTIDTLRIYCDGSAYGTVSDFRRRHGELYDEVFDSLLSMAQNDVRVQPATVVDAEFRPADQKTEEPEQGQVHEDEQPVSQAEQFRNEINSLNDAIPDEEISNALYETTSLLKQLGELEVQFPESKDKLSKLYKTYLPYMIEILKQYVKMQNVQTDPNYARNEKALKQTIEHINSAMKDRLIPSMSENDSINLSADMNTLESMLRKDGMTDDNDIASLLKKNQQESEQGKQS